MRSPIVSPLPVGPLSSHSTGDFARPRRFKDTLEAAVKTVLCPVLRISRRWVWEADLDSEIPGVRWGADERLILLGPDNIDGALTPQLLEFLGGDSASDELDGVRRGDRLFVVVSDSGFLCRSYIFLDTTSDTRRQVRILGEQRGTPVIGLSFTAPAARGRRLYQRVLLEMFRWLRAAGFRRVVCEVHPDNTPSNKASAAAGMRLCRELTDWRFANAVLAQRVVSQQATNWRFLWLRGASDGKVE